jgi:hypothetical protein
MGKDKNNKEVKKMRTKAKRTLLKTNSCALSQIRVFQDVYDLKDDDILKSIAGCTGGLLGKGSSCGIVFSGALSLAMLMDSKLSEWKTEDEVKLHALIKDYINWWHEKYGTTRCRERVKLNFWKRRGVMGLLQPQKIYKCLSQASKAMEHLYSIKDTSPEIDSSQFTGFSNSFHCARPVFEEVRKSTSVGNPRLERMSVALDGGIGLQGVACGAITGAIMAISLHSGVKNMELSMLKNMRAFFKSAKKQRKMKPSDSNDVFVGGKKIIEGFLEQTGTLECKDITNTRFDNWKEFQQFGASSEKCKELIDFCAKEAIKFINLPESENAIK